MDDRGNLIAFWRMDTAKITSIHVATNRVEHLLLPEPESLLNEFT